MANAMLQPAPDHKIIALGADALKQMAEGKYPTMEGRSYLKELSESLEKIAAKRAIGDPNPTG